MPTYRLEMTFKNNEGRTSKISVDNAKSDITEFQVNEVMNTILDRNIFTSGGGDLVEKAKAELISIDVTEFEIL